MITLVKDKSFIKVFNWKDIFEMPGYTGNLNPKEEKLKQIIGKYEFSTMDKCGLSNCKTPHNTGYIVSTESGKLTNLGHICGKNHFGLDFTSLSRQFKRDLRDYQARQRIESFLQQHENYVNRIGSIESSYGSVDDIYHLQQFFIKPTKGCPTPILDQLSKMARTRDSTIYTIQKLTNEEYEILESSGQKGFSQFNEVPIDHLEGLPFIFRENDLRIFATEFRIPFERLIDLDVSNFTSSELDYWSKTIGKFDNILNHTIEILQYGRKFCEPQNIQKFEYFMSNEHKSWRQFLRTINTKFNIII